PEFLIEDRQHDSIRRLAHVFDLERRDFLKLLGGGVLVGISASSPAQESGGAHRQDSEGNIPDSLAAWIHIAEDDAITVNTGKVEIGQNIRTSLAQQVAEELRVPISAIQLVMAGTALTPFDAVPLRPEATGTLLTSRAPACFTEKFFGPQRSMQH